MIGELLIMGNAIFIKINKKIMNKINIKDLLKLIPNSIDYKVFGEIENHLFITNAKSTLDSNEESITFIDSARTKDEKTKWSIESKA